MALKGNLRDFSTTQLFNLINLARKTGTLTIDVTDHSSRIAFREGKLIFASMDGTSSSLLSILQQAGKLSIEQSRTIHNNKEQTSDKELGLMLINAGLVSQNDIIQSVRQYILDVVFRLFTWAEGMFRFEPNELPPPDIITVPINLESVIMEGSRRLKEWERLQDELPDLDMALKFTDRPDARLRNINLTVEEWRVVSFINPRNTIRQISKANNMSDFQIRRIVYGMLQAGLVELIQPKGIIKPAPTGAAPDLKEKKEPPRHVTQAPSVKRSLILRLIDRIRRI
ncbi:MAG: DUF4388 domain-containing protein [Anaerolineales bacterium]|nr:DUF4388 domain-containing protein [Anaerolineales bacterium]